MDCVFCAIAAGQIPSRQIYSDDAAITVLDIEPWHTGHSVVISRRHVTDLTQDAAVLASIAPAVAASARLLIERLGAQGMNVLSNIGQVSGQSVFHLHVHLIPRYASNPGMTGLLNRQGVEDPDEVYARIMGTRAR